MPVFVANLCHYNAYSEILTEIDLSTVGMLVDVPSIAIDQQL